MTISKFYSAIVGGSHRTFVPTMRESRHDYRLMQEARIAGTFGRF